jgi:hypothetical protein
MRGQEWLCIRKDILVPQHFIVSSENLSEEIRQMYPVFDLIARWNDAAAATKTES